MSQRAEISHLNPCPRCKRESTVSYVVYANGPRIRASRSISCDNCGYREARDRSYVPEDVATLFYQRDGKWRLTLQEVCGPEDVATRAVAELFGISEMDSRARLGGIPESTPAIVGVKAVVDEARAFLLERGIGAQVERE